MHLARPDVTTLAASPIPRSQIAIGLEPSVRGRLASLAGDRSVVIGFYASESCKSVWVGDITAGWLQPGESRPGLVRLAPIEGVEVRADERLLELLATAGPALRLAGPGFARHLAVTLDDPAAWLSFLNLPVAHRRLA